MRNNRLGYYLAMLHEGQVDVVVPPSTDVPFRTLMGVGI